MKTVEVRNWGSDTLHLELEQEDDGRWLADVMDIPGCMAYGATQDEAVVNVLKLADRAIKEFAKTLALVRRGMEQAAAGKTKVLDMSTLARDDDP